MVGKATSWDSWGDKVGALSSSARLQHKAPLAPLLDSEIMRNWLNFLIPLVQPVKNMSSG